MAKDQHDLALNIVIVGASATGKSQIALQFTKETFSEEYTKTLGGDSSCKHVLLDGKNVKFEIWSTSGHERFRSYRSSFYKTAHAVFFVYDATNETSLDKISSFYEEVNEKNPNAIKILVGNKYDLTEKIVVTKEAVEKYAEGKFVLCKNVSAKNLEEINKVFEDTFEICNKKNIIQDKKTEEISKDKKIEEVSKDEKIEKITKEKIKEVYYNNIKGFSFRYYHLFYFSCKNTDAIIANLRSRAKENPKGASNSTIISLQLNNPQ